VQNLSLSEFTQLFANQQKNIQTSSKYCFLLGAGASKSSGIPTGEELAKTWFNQIKNMISEEEFSKWKLHKKIDETKLAASYSAIYERCFRANKADGYAEIQSQLENKEPSIGYAYLAKILAETQNRFVITTNFDSLIEDSLFLYTRKKPLVCGHESLASYINVHASRPTIVKIHRDVLFDPISDPDGTSKLKAEWKEALKPLLEGFRLVVIGYGGNDGSLMDYLAEIKEKRNPIYWCIRKQDTLDERVEKILTKEDYIVIIDGFDELLVEISAKAGIEINPEEFVNNAKNRKEKFMAEQTKFVKQIDENIDNATTEGKKVSETLQWWVYQFKINAEKDPKKKDELYQKAITELPNSSELHGNYANFLKNIRKEYDLAEKHYKNALEIKPNDADINGNYALFLHNTHKDYDLAEQYYKKALEIEPNHANNNGNYAAFLHDIRKEHDVAEDYYKKALEIEQNNANIHGNYAAFLHDIRKEYDLAEKYYMKALGIEPNRADINGNYALFLKGIRKEYDLAEKYYMKALELKPNDASLNGNYAIFLKDARKNYDLAEKYYKNALEIEPNNANFNGNFGGFLYSLGKKQEAKIYIDKAMTLSQAEKIKDLEIELWFYILAHEQNRYEEAKSKIDELLAKEYKSKGWNFESNIEQAKKEKHPHIDTLVEYAKKITEI